MNSPISVNLNDINSEDISEFNCILYKFYFYLFTLLFFYFKVNFDKEPLIKKRK